MHSALLDQHTQGSMSEILARFVGLGLLAESHLVQFRALTPVVGTVDMLSSGFAHGSLSLVTMPVLLRGFVDFKRQGF